MTGATEQQEVKPQTVAEEMSKQTSAAQSKPAKPYTKPKRDSNQITKTSASATSDSAKSDDVQKTEKSTWDSFKESVKQGSTNKAFCSDAERSLKQCE